MLSRASSGPCSSLNCLGVASPGAFLQLSACSWPLHDAVSEARLILVAVAGCSTPSSAAVAEARY